MGDQSAITDQIYAAIDCCEAELTLRRAERLYREARALWWATLLLAGVTLVFGAYLLGMM